MSARALLESVREVEAAREEMREPSFMAGLFAGEPDFGLLLPFPGQDSEDRRIGDDYCARVASVLRERVDPEEIERSGTIPTSAIQALKEVGAFGMVIPPEYGGLGLSQTNYNRVLALVASHCNILALLLSVHQSIGVARPLLMFGSEEQKRRWLPRLARGAISAFGLTEPQIGSDPANMATTAARQADGSYLVNGEKLWTTNGPIAEVMVLTAKVDGKVTAFLLELDTPGIEVLHRCDFMGCRGIENGWLRFRDVRVPAENLLGREGRGLRIALSLLNVGRVSVAAICLGMMRQILPPTIAWANERWAFGKPIGRHELNAHKLARMAADVFASEAVVWLASALEDRGGSDYRVEAAAAKLFASERLWSVVDGAMQIRGGRGYEKAWSQAARGEEPFPVEQLFRDARLYLIGEGASEILKLFIAREVWDPHLKRAAPFFAAGGAEKVQEAGRLARFYAGWYARRVVPPRDQAHPEDALPRFAREQLGYVRRTSRRLARVGLRLMAWHREGLEERQGLVARLAEIGVELFVISACAGYAMARPGAEELAGQVFRDARRRVEDAFAGLADNDDRAVRLVGEQVLAGGFAGVLGGSLMEGPHPLAPSPARGRGGTQREGEGQGPGPWQPGAGAPPPAPPSGRAEISAPLPGSSPGSARRAGAEVVPTPPAEGAAGAAPPAEGAPAAIALAPGAQPSAPPVAGAQDLAPPAADGPAPASPGAQAQAFAPEAASGTAGGPAKGVSAGQPKAADALGAQGAAAPARGPLGVYPRENPSPLPSRWGRGQRERAP
jgi:hypothetical protein